MSSSLLIGKGTAWLLLLLFSFPTLSSSNGNMFNLLMLGNSYTYYNDLPEIVSALIEESLGLTADDVWAREMAGGGKTWTNHRRANVFPHRLRQFKYDWIVLQEQSLTPGLYDYSSYFTDSMESLKWLNNEAEKGAPEGEVILYMTWGRREGKSSNFQNLYPTYEDMQVRITEGYTRYQEAISTPERPVKIAPVGLGFQKIYEKEVFEHQNPNPGDREGPENDFLNLYANDGSHQSWGGSALAAYIIFATITGRDPRGLQWMSSKMTKKVTEEFRDRLQEVAAEVVEDYYVQTLIPMSEPGMKQLLPAVGAATDDSGSVVIPVPVPEPVTEPVPAPMPDEPVPAPMPDEPVQAPTLSSIVPTYTEATPPELPMTDSEPAQQPHYHGMTPAVEGPLKILFLGGHYLSATEDLLKVMLEAEYGESLELFVKHNFAHTNLLTPLNRLRRSHKNLGLKFATEKFTHVVLQEQSQIPGLYGYELDTGIGYQEYKDSLDVVVELDLMIQQNGANTFFMETWGRKDGDYSNPSIFPNYVTMQEYTSQGYVRYVEATGSVDRPVHIAAVGKAINNAYNFVYDDGQGFPLNEGTYFSRLFDPENDRGGLSPEGNYLAALVLYSTLTGKDPRLVQVGVPDSMEEDYQDFLQEMARSVTMDDDFIAPVTPRISLEENFVTEAVTQNFHLDSDEVTSDETIAPSEADSASETDSTEVVGITVEGDEEGITADEQTTVDEEGITADEQTTVDEEGITADEETTVIEEDTINEAITAAGLTTADEAVVPAEDDGAKDAHSTGAETSLSSSSSSMIVRMSRNHAFFTAIATGFMVYFM